MILLLAEKIWHSFLEWMVWMLIQLSKGCRNNVSILGRKDFGIPFKGWMNCWFDRDINIHSIHCIVSATWRKEQKKTMKWFCFQKIGRTCFCLCKLAWKYVINLMLLLWKTVFVAWPARVYLKRLPHYFKKRKMVILLVNVYTLTLFIIMTELYVLTVLRSFMQLNGCKREHINKKDRFKLLP